MDHERYRRLHSRSGAAMEKASFAASLKGKQQIAEGTWAFVFEKPDGFRFKAGQHVRMTLVDPPETDGEGDSRFFSLASTPREPDLVIAMRMRDTAFKRVLGRMQSGDKVRLQIRLDIPYGAFALHDDPARPAVFLVGGIGIAPVFSMIKDALERKLSHRLFLFYSNRRPEDAAYLEELRELSDASPSFKMIATMTEAEKSVPPWEGATGRLERSLLAKHVGDLKSANYYLSGLPDMVSGMKAMLADSGVGEDRVHAEEFTGFNLNEMRNVAAPVRKRRILIAAMVLAAIVAVVLHAGVAVSISRNGLGEFLSQNPIANAMLGFALVLVVLKLKYFSALHLLGRGLLGRAFSRHGDHAPPSNATKRSRPRP
jgi:ferredoxin-NADP reductase